MSIFVLIGIVIAICKTAEYIRQRRAAEQMERIKREQFRQREYIRQQQAAAREHERRQTALEREQIRLAKEQEKQALLLAKHEEEIRNLKYRMRTCEGIVESTRQRIENLEEIYELVSAELEEADRVGDDKRKEKALRKIVTLDSQLASARDKQRKAKHDWNTAKQKLSA